MFKWRDDFHRVVLSGPKPGAGVDKIIVRPILMKGARKIQIEEFVGEEKFHKNLDMVGARKYIERMTGYFEKAHRIGKPGTGEKREGKK